VSVTTKKRFNQIDTWLQEFVTLRLCSNEAEEEKAKMSYLVFLDIFATL
jgi:hypothetical protein